MQGHFYKPNCPCVDAKGESKKTKKCGCGATWSYILDLGKKPDGSRNQKKKGGFKTKSAAEDAAAIIVTSFKEGTHVDEKKTNFKDFAPIWLKAYAHERQVKPPTLRIRQNEINNLMPFFEYLMMKDITMDDYQNAMYALKTGYTNKDGEVRKPLADNTMDGIHSTGRAIFRHAVKIKTIKTDPTLYTYVPKKPKTIEERKQDILDIKYLEKEELALLLKTAATDGLEDDLEIFTLLAYSGIRDGELCALQKPDFVREDEIVDISKTLYNPKNNTIEYQLGTTKTTKSTRRVVLEPEMFDMIDKQIEKVELFKEIHGEDYHDKDFVFVSKKYPGYPYYVKKIENRFRRLLKIAGLNTDLTPHSLRHTHVSLLAEAGVPLQDIQDRLGHLDDDTTKFIYLHITKPKKKEASHKFGELMKSFFI